MISFASYWYELLLLLSYEFRLLLVRNATGIHRDASAAPSSADSLPAKLGGCLHARESPLSASGRDARSGEIGGARRSGERGGVD